MTRSQPSTECPKRWPVVLFMTAVVCAACRGEDPRPVPLAVARSSSPGGVDTIRLSISLNAVADGEVLVDTLRRSLSLRPGSDILHITDVATLGDGQFVILDRDAMAVFVLGADGSVLTKFGRAGKGPGEWRSPKAVAKSGSSIVVWDANPNRWFHVYDFDGTLLHAGSAVEVEGDWFAMWTRGERLWLEHPQQSGWEDHTRRLDASAPGQFLHFIAEDERTAALRGLPFDYERPRGYIVRYNFDSEVIDTISETSFGPLIEQPTTPPAYPQFKIPLWSPLPVWTAGDGWIAVAADGSLPVIEVVDARDLSHVLSIGWPDSRAKIDDEEQLLYADWYIEERVLKLGDEAMLRNYHRTSARERRRSREIIVNEYTLISERRPEVMAGYGAGRCLWLSGFNPVDQVSGVARTWVGINTETKALEGVVHIPRRGSRVRAFGREAVYTSYFDSTAVSILERYDLPPNSC